MNNNSFLQQSDIDALYRFIKSARKGEFLQLIQSKGIPSSLIELHHQDVVIRDLPEDDNVKTVLFVTSNLTITHRIVHNKKLVELFCAFCRIKMGLEYIAFVTTDDFRNQNDDNLHIYRHK